MSTFMDEFESARNAFESMRQQWNALPSPEARQASGLNLDLPDNARILAASDLLTDARSRHKIEQRVSVYLVLSADNEWEVDNPRNDGRPLFGYDNGAINEDCEHERGPELDRECELARQAADILCELPNYVRLRDMLNQQLS